MNAQPATLARLAQAYDLLAGEEICGHMNHSEYRKLVGINASVLKKPTTLEMLYALQEPESLKYAFQFGSLVHLAILEPDKFDGDRTPWLVQIDTATLKSKAAENAYEANPDKIIASQRMIDKAAKARDAFYAHKQATRIMEQQPQTEVAYQSWNNLHGCWQKGLLDIDPGPESTWLADLKTTTIDLGLENKLSWEIRDRGYDFSSAYYARLHEARHGVQIENVVLCWITGPTSDSADVNDEPWMCRLQVMPRVPPNKDTVAFAPCFDAIDSQLNALLTAARTDVWTAYEEERLEF